MNSFFQTIHLANGTESKRQLDTSHIYEGEVLGDKESFVHGSISDGIFHGRIVTSKDTYFVENAKYYFPDTSQNDIGFHSVIYKDKHVNDPYREQRTVHPNGCGLTEEISQWMDRVQNSHDDNEPPEIEIIPIDNNKSNNETTKSNVYEHVKLNKVIDIDESPFQRYSKEANQRSKRAATAARLHERNTCTLYIQTDPLIWRHIRESIPDVNSLTFSFFYLNLYYIF
jgi:disintegrin and metalloproteinase domain-containing protein 10